MKLFDAAELPHRGTSEARSRRIPIGRIRCRVGDPHRWGDWVFKNITYVLEDRGYLPVKNPMRIPKMSQVSGAGTSTTQLCSTTSLRKGKSTFPPFLVPNSAQSVATAIKYKAILTYFEGLQIRKAEGVGARRSEEAESFRKGPKW